MSALVARINKTLYSPPRVLVAVLALTVLSGILIFTLMQTVQARQYETRTVLYGVEMIAPLESAVCPGPKALRYPVTVIVNESALPDQVMPAEAWCVAGLTGGCTSVDPPGDGEMPILAPRHLEVITERDVPDGLRPGVVYEFQHSIRSANGEVSGYIVSPITLRDDCP